MKKRIVCLVLALIMLMSLCVSASAAYTQKVAINYRAIKLVLNGERIIPCDGAGTTVEPFIMSSSGTTYLPLRAVAQALGLNVIWDGVANTVTLTSGGKVKTGDGPEGKSYGEKRVEITYRGIRVFLNGEELNLVNANGDTVEPFILNSNSSVYLPLRIIGEALGLKVGWDGAISTVYLEGTADDSGVEDVELDSFALYMDIGDGKKINGSVVPADAKEPALKWYSDNESVAVVDAFGNIAAVGEGTANITAEAVNGKKASCPVYVCDGYFTVYYKDGTVTTATADEVQWYLTDYSSLEPVSMVPSDGGVHENVYDWTYGEGYIYLGGSGAT